MEKINVVLDMSILDAEINELKLSLFKDNLHSHSIIREDEYTIIELKRGEKITDEKTIIYGREINGKLYLARMQRLQSLAEDTPDFYDEFFSNGVELKIPS